MPPCHGLTVGPSEQVSLTRMSSSTVAAIKQNTGAGNRVVGYRSYGENLRGSPGPRPLGSGGLSCIRDAANTRTITTTVPQEGFFPLQMQRELHIRPAVVMQLWVLGCGCCTYRNGSLLCRHARSTVLALSDPLWKRFRLTDLTADRCYQC